MRGNRSVKIHCYWRQQKPCLRLRAHYSTWPLALDVISVTVQIWLVGRQTSDRLSHTISVRGLCDSPCTHKHTVSRRQDQNTFSFSAHTELCNNRDIRSVSDWRNQGVAARPRHIEVKYVWTKGHRGSSINTVTLLSNGYSLECCYHTYTHFQIKPSL